MKNAVAEKSDQVALLSLSCCEAARLASEALDRDLTRRERWALRIHTFLCRGCRQFAAQLRVLRQALSAAPEQLRQQWHDGAAKLSPERREDIKRLLAEAAKKPPG